MEIRSLLLLIARILKLIVETPEDLKGSQVNGKKNKDIFLLVGQDADMRRSRVMRVQDAIQL